MCERLAADGFVVIAPTFADSRTTGVEGSPSRSSIVSACRAHIEQDDPSDGWQWGIIGHSAGADTVLAHPARFSLGRVCLCIGWYDMHSHVTALESGEPLLLVWSENDGTNLQPASASGWCRCDGCRKAITDAQWHHCTVCADYDLCKACYAKQTSQSAVRAVEGAKQSTRRGVHAQAHDMRVATPPLDHAALLAAERSAGRPLLECSAPEEVEQCEIGQRQGGDEPRRLSLVYRGEDAPCHLSLLYAPSNDALLKIVAPLLPIAKAIGARAFDLDRYARRRDAEEVGKRLAPAVAHFVALNHATSAPT